MPEDVGVWFKLSSGVAECTKGLLIMIEELPGHMDYDEQRRRLAEIIRNDPDLMYLLAAARELELPQWRIVGGCLYQTVWNVLTHRAARTGIKDYDLIYFDDRDLSWEAEGLVMQQVSLRMTKLPAPIDVRNQARVHLWFKDRFGADYKALQCADEGLARYASVVHAVGVRLDQDDSLDIVAPFGLDDLFNMVIRRNPALDNTASHETKAARAKLVWPEVVVISSAVNENRTAG